VALTSSFSTPRYLGVVRLPDEDSRADSAAEDSLTGIVELEAKG
jgi:hypothetical protein